MEQRSEPAGRVLVCDDEASTRDILGTFLRRHGFEVLTAADGDEAVRQAAACRPDLVLLDLMLPRRDGFTVLAQLRGAEATRRIPVLLISAEPAAEHAATARTLGAAGYIAKPFDLPEVLSQVRAALATGPPGSDGRPEAGSGNGAERRAR
ncbi:MAG: hypothetical protein KatS3mg102_1827 [Planctomycetota bacterium]|nr:MAG: hypothetical protein KatS3mg102_1827 [Planctomycetota bacterium]